MAVERVVTNVKTDQMVTARAFYGEVLGMTLVMDHGWIVTLAGTGDASPQISFAAEGGSGAPVPDLSIEVDNLAEIHRRLIDAGHRLEYRPATEPWDVRGFFVRDPFGQ